MAKVFTMSEVAAHNNSNDCWLVIFGKVYDVTSFLEEHPGGDDVLLAETGRDATPEFDKVGHTHDAWSRMEKLYVGEIDRSTLPNTSTSPVSLVPTSESKGKKAKYLMYLLQFLLPLIMLNFAVAYYTKSSA